MTTDTARRALLRSVVAAGLGGAAVGTLAAASPASAISATQVFDVRDYGAVGDGVTDDSVRFQSALDAAAVVAGSGGALVWVTPGTYLLAQRLSVPANTTIWAYGATVLGTGRNQLLANFPYGVNPEAPGFNGHSRITVLGGVWDTRAQLAQAGDKVNTFTFASGHGFTIRDATLRNTISYHAIELRAVNGAVVSNCRFEGFRAAEPGRTFSEAIQLDRTIDRITRNVTISGCYVGPSTECGSFGTGFGSHTGRDYVYYENIRIVDNLIEGVIDKGIRLFDYRYAVISGNIVRGSASYGIYVRVSDPAPGDVDDANVANNPHDVVITGNVIESAGDQGIRVEGDEQGATISSVTVSSNIVRDSGGTGICLVHCVDSTVSYNTVISPDSNGVTIEKTTRSLVSGNRISSPASYGVVLVRGASDCLVAGNLITNAPSAGVRASANCNYNTITGNTVRGAGTAVSITDTCIGNTCVLNDFSGYGNSANTVVGSTIRKTLTQDTNVGLNFHQA